MSGSTIHLSSPPITPSPGAHSLALSSSPPLPSPGTLVRKFSTADKPLTKPKQSQVDLWEIPDSEPDAPAPPPKPKPKPRARKNAAEKDAKPKTTTRKSKAASELRDVKSNKAADMGDLHSNYFTKTTKAEGQRGNRIATVATEDLNVLPYPGEEGIAPKVTTITLDSSPAPTESETAVSFTGRLETLRYAKGNLFGDRSVATSINEGSTMLLTKKRSVEMISIPSARRTSTGKTKAAKAPKAKTTKTKKSSTTTAIATGIYGEEVAGSSITEFFAVEKSKTSTTKRKTVTAKAPKKPKRRKSDEVVTELLTPVSAQKKLDAQSFEFGTWSQLVGGGDIEPTTNDRAVAIEAVDVEEQQRGPLELVQVLSCIQRETGSGLWDIAKLDDDDDCRSPSPTQSDTLDPSGPAFDAALMRTALDNFTVEDPPSTKFIPIPGPVDTVDLTETPVIKRPRGRPRKTPPPVGAESSGSPVREPSLVARPRGRPRKTPLPSSQPPPSIREPSAEPAVVKPVPKARSRSRASAPPTTKHPNQPDFNTHTTAQLQVQLSSYGFKKISSRKAMIATMERCWRAQNGIPSSPAPGSDTDDGPTPAPRRSKSPARKRAPSKEPTRKRATSAEQRQRAGSARPSYAMPTEEMFVKISDAIRKDNGAWHEMTLMYDPIVLEDLTAWLNRTGLASVGVDDEVKVADVRAWCDRNSVCSLAKETQKGLERKRF